MLGNGGEPMGNGGEQNLFLFFPTQNIISKIHFNEVDPSFQKV